MKNLMVNSEIAMDCNDDDLFFLFFLEVMGLLESEFQSRLVKELKDRLPGCIILKNDSSYCQGIPDLIILYGNKWAALECKKNARASHRPNQEYYVEQMDKMSFADFIYPECKFEVLEDLEAFLCDS